MTEKPLVTISGKKVLFNSSLSKRISQDLSQESVEWHRRLDSKTKYVYIDVDFVDFEVDNVERSSELLSRVTLKSPERRPPSPSSKQETVADHSIDQPDSKDDQTDVDVQSNQVEGNPSCDSDLQHSTSPTDGLQATSDETTEQDISKVFFNQKLLGRPILHTYWADKTDFEGDNQRAQFEEWIGQVQASTCTEWAIIVIEDGDFKGQIGTALFKSKLHSSASQANASSSSLSSMSHASSTSFLDRMKKGLSTIFQSDSNSDRWLTLINQDKLPDSKAQESYANFVKKLRNVMMASFSKQIELYEEQLRIQRDLRTAKCWDFYSYFLMQEDLAFAFEFLTLFDEALVQYEILDALFTDYISSASFNERDEPLYEQWVSFRSWAGLCLDKNCNNSIALRKRVGERKASLLDMRNYLFARRCDLMLLQNEPWRVAASTIDFINNCIREHCVLKIKVVPGALTCWSFVSALEVLQKCECYSCTSTMENYSFHTVDIWNNARLKLLEIGQLAHRLPGLKPDRKHEDLVAKLISGLGSDPHNGVSYQSNDISPQARLRDALSGEEQFSKHLIEISELTLGTYKHIGRKRHALLVGRELASFYMAQNNHSRAISFLSDLERHLKEETWTMLMADVEKYLAICSAKAKHEQDTPMAPLQGKLIN